MITHWGAGLEGGLTGAAGGASPGDTDITSGSIEAMPLGVVAFVGRTLKGPLDEPEYL